MEKKDNYIEIEGAKVHNLKNINLKIPREKLVVITVYQEVVNHHLPLTRFILRDKEDTWRRFLRMLDNF